LEKNRGEKMTETKILKARINHIKRLEKNATEEIFLKKK